jgi:hypothetical protein
MKRRSFLQMLAAVPVAIASLNVKAGEYSLDAAPFVLPENPKLPDAGLNRGSIKAQDIVFPSDDLGEELRVIYISYRYEPVDEVTRRSIVSDMSQVCLSFEHSRKLYEFLIVCDVTNNPPSLVDNNDLVVDVWVRQAGSVNLTQYHFDKSSLVALSPTQQ